MSISNVCEYLVSTFSVLDSTSFLSILSKGCPAAACGEHQDAAISSVQQIDPEAVPQRHRTGRVQAKEVRPPGASRRKREILMLRGERAGECHEILMKSS